MSAVSLYLWIPSKLCLERLSKREAMRFGKERISCGGDMYDTGGLDIRSKSTHEKWMDKTSCPILRIERQVDLDESIRMVKNKIYCSF